MTEPNKLPWPERLNMLSINPDAATRQDIARMAAEASSVLYQKRIQRVHSAGWLSFTDLCFHCGIMETEMRELTKRRDFPKPANPTGSTKGKRWSKDEVDVWMAAHKLEMEHE